MDGTFVDYNKSKYCKSAVFGQQQQEMTPIIQQEQRSRLSQSQKLLNQADSMHQSFMVKDAQSQINKSSSSIKGENIEVNSQQKKKGKFEELMFQIKLKFFARKLLNQTRSRMFKNLTSRQFKLIEDVSCDENLIINRQNQDYNSKYKSANTISSKTKSSSYIGRKLLKSKSSYTLTKKIYKCILDVQCLSSFLQSFDKLIPVLEPSSFVKVLWDLFAIILLSCYFFLIPLYMTFISLRNDQFYNNLVISVPIFIIIDFLFRINTGFYEKGTSQSRYADILLLSLIWKINPFLSTLNKLEEYSFFTKKQKNVIALFKLIFTLMIIAHILSCLWIVLAEFLVNQGKKTWLKNNTFQGTTWHQIYIDAYYFTTVTMITVGYGDIIPISEEEKTVCILFMLFSCGIFGYSMNTVGSILQNFNEDQVIMRQNMGIINAYMKRKNVSKKTQNAIREYLEYYWREENDRNQEQEEKILNVLSENLRENLLIEGKGVVLKQSAIFRDNFSDSIKQKIVPLIKEIHITPEEVICTQGEMDDCSIYFIEKGSVNILVENDLSHDFVQSMPKQIATLMTGQSFGEISFFTGKPRTATIKSKEFTTVQLIKRQDFLNVIYNLQDDYEQFCNIKDNIWNYSDFQLIDVRCLSCQSLNHHVIQCPYLHFIPNQAKLREQFISCAFQERKLLTRKTKKRLKSITLIKENFYFANKFQELDSDVQDYIDAFLENEDSSERLDRTEEDNESEQFFFKNNDAVTQQGAVSQLNNVEEIQKRDSSVQQLSKYQNSNIQQLILADVNQKQNHADISPTKQSDEIDQHGNLARVNQSNTQVNKPKAKHMSYIINQDDDSQMQKSKMGSSSYKIESSLGENRRSLVGDTFVQPTGKFNYEENYQNDQGEKILPMTISQLAIPKQRGSQSKITKTLEFYTSALQKYQHVYNKMLQVLMEGVPGIQQQQFDLQSPSIKQHVSSTQIVSNGPTELLKITNNNNRKIEKKSSFLVKNQSSMNNSKLPSSRNILAKQVSEQQYQKVEFDKRRVSLFDQQLLFTTKETNYVNDATNNLQYVQSVKEMEKDFYEQFNFDLMKNFTYYFPLNNFNHQVKLMSLNEEQRRKKMLRNHIENINLVRKTKSFAISNKKGKRRSSINSSQNMSKIQAKQIDREDLEESQYTKKRSKFYQSQTNKLEASSIWMGESSKRFDKLESQSQYQGKKSSNPFNINSITFNNQLDNTQNKSFKSQHLKILQQETNLDNQDDSNHNSSILKNRKLSLLVKKENKTLDEDLVENHIIRKIETNLRDQDYDSMVNSMNLQNENDNSILKIMNASQEDNQKINSRVAQNEQKEYLNQNTIKLSLKKATSSRNEEQSQGCYSRKEQEFDVQTEYSQNRRNININSIQIGLKNKNKL